MTRSLGLATGRQAEAAALVVLDELDDELFEDELLELDPESDDVLAGVELLDDERESVR